MDLRESLEANSRSDLQLVVDRLLAMPSVDDVREWEAELAQRPQIDLSTEHLVHGGMYARTILIPAGAGLTGALTSMDNVCIVCGDIAVTTDSGVQRLTGYHVLPAKAGAKRAGVALADTYWTTIWPTQLTDIEAIEDEATCESHLLQTRRQVLGFEPMAELEGRN